MAPSTYKVLTPEDVENFLTHGLIRIPQAIPPEKVASFTSEVWARLGYSPTDTSTWLVERSNMPTLKQTQLQDLSPKAWGAMCDLLGGEDRVDPESARWGDGFICNFGSEKWDEKYKQFKEGVEGAENPNDPQKLTNWHIDGDTFIHFLDSREQGLLVIPLFSDVPTSGGATMVCPDGIAKLAKWLMDHPQGVMPLMKPADWPEDEANEQFAQEAWYNKTIQTCSDFREMTGKAGDVVLMHPLMMHSASRNLLRTQRLIINPQCSLKEPFNYDREDPSEYSLVERKTLKELAKIEGNESLSNGLKGWKITTERRSVVPERVKIQAAMKKLEEARLRGEDVGPNLQEQGGMLMV